MGSLLARAYKRILRGKLAQDEGEHWVTVNAGSKEGGEGGGSHVLLDGEGRVVAGMGGKFKGQNIDRIERKKFINQNAWNRQRKTLIEKAGDDTQLKRVVTAGMRSQAEKEADKSNDTWQKEGLYNALVRKTQRENKGMINVLHDHLDYKNAQPKAVNPIAEKIQKQSDGVKQIVTEAITKYNDLEAVNQLNSVPDGVNVVTEKGQFFKTGDLWSSPDGKKTLENDQMFRLLKKELKAKQEAPKTDRKSLIDQVNARHTMPMGDIIARKEQAITDKINNSNLSEEDKKKYLDKLNSLTDEALKAGAGSLDLYKVGVSYKKTNAETNAFNKMFNKQGEIDNLEKEINKKVQDNVTQAENKLTSNSLNEAERTGAVYFMDPNGKEFYRAHSKSKTWYQINQYNQAKGEKAKAKQEALNAKKQQEAPKTEEQPKGKLHNYHEVINISDKAYKERAKLVKEMRALNVSNPGEELTISKYGRTFKRVPDIEGVINTNWREVGRNGEPYNREYAYKAATDNNEEREEYKNWKERRNQWLRNAGINPGDIDNQPLYFYDKATNTESFYNAYDPNGTWSKYDDNLPEKDYKFFKEAKQRAKDAGLEVKDDQPRTMKNAFSDKYQKIDNSNLNKYQEVDNISNNKNTENGVTNMNTNQESQAKTEAKITKPANTNMSVKAYEGKANINPRVATYLEDMGMKLSKAQYDKIATDYPAGDRSGNASALAGKDMRALQAFKKDYAKEISNTIANQEAAFEDVGGYHDFKGGSITISKKSEIGNMLHERQHAIISFAGKPSEETRSLLKKNGFTYNPRYKTWENTGKLGNANHEKILQALRDGVTIETTQQATPTAQPTPQAEGKQYHGTGIENKNGRFEISFNDFPSYKLRTDMKNNGFRWDPNAKVWHTTDREKLDQVLSKHFSERDAGESPTQA